MAYSHRLAAGALHHEALLEIINYVNEVPAKSEMFSFVNEPFYRFLIETSYIYRPEENIFVLILHVPLVILHNLMPLYECVLMPVHFNFSGNISVTPDIGINNMIPVGYSESYQTLSILDLQNCIKMGETYFCKGRNVLLTDLSKTCISSLYLASANNIQ
jgi:hypothetical protein